MNNLFYGLIKQVFDFLRSKKNQENVYLSWRRHEINLIIKERGFKENT